MKISTYIVMVMMFCLILTCLMDFRRISGLEQREREMLDIIKEMEKQIITEQTLNKIQNRVLDAQTQILEKLLGEENVHKVDEGKIML